MTKSIVTISDTHGLHASIDIPPGDILVHAGDLTRHGEIDELLELNEFIGTLPHPVKIVIAGNHDFCFERNPEECRERLTNCIYLEDQSVTIEGLKFYGSPWQPWFYDWAFNLQRGEEIRAKWDLIPEDTDILITHGPPQGIGDMTASCTQAGCKDLLDRVRKIKPQLHIFGHIHEAYGVYSNQHTTFINASVCDLSYAPLNKPIVHNCPLTDG